MVVFFASLLEINRAAAKGLLTICEWPNSLSVFQGLVREANLGRRKIIMGLQISLGKVVAAFDCNILILCEALHFILRLQCNLAYMICWRGESKIVKALEW